MSFGIQRGSQALSVSSPLSYHWFGSPESTLGLGAVPLSVTLLFVYWRAVHLSSGPLGHLKKIISWQHSDSDSGFLDPILTMGLHKGG